jgi:3',5'-cyclic-AMP phosphodiesterase
MKRRNFLGYSLAIPAAASLSLDASAAKKKKSFRVAHITDIHVKPGEIPEKGMAKALQAVQSLSIKADFIINSGDSIMDALEADRPKAQTEWNLFNQIMKLENTLPVYSCIGNHDVWGWFNKSEEDKQANGYGKQWAVDELKIPARYYYVEKGNWAFLFLDSTQLNPAGGYIAYVDDQQMEWLNETLNKLSNKNICIVSHIPILSICAGLFFKKTEANGDLLIKRNLMHTDFFKLNELFGQYKNIKACISGHIHLQDDVTYGGIRYLCNGAVSGNWWKGSFQGFAPAFATLDFYDDGTITREMISY